MTTTLIKKRLTKAINEIDDSAFLHALHTIVNSKKDESLNPLTTAQKKELDKRKKNQKTGRKKTYSWAEVKRSLLKK